MKLPILLAATSLLSCGISAAVTYSGNGNSGFGGVVSSLEITDDGTDMTFVFDRGNGGFNNALVIYIDSTVGGQSTTADFTDTDDSLRRAISGFNGSSRATVNFPSGFGVDRALALEAGFAGLWQTLNNSSHTFLQSANLTPAGSTADTYSMTVSLANLGLTPGSSMSFVATYLNAGDSFRSDEAIGDGIAAGNPGQNTVTFTAARTYTTIPEPSSSALGLVGALLLFRRRK